MSPAEFAYLLSCNLLGMYASVNKLPRPVITRPFRRPVEGLAESSRCKRFEASQVERHAKDG